VKVSTAVLEINGKGVRKCVRVSRLHVYALLTHVSVVVAFLRRGEAMCSHQPTY
jgi:hypothetical protein